MSKSIDSDNVESEYSDLTINKIPKDLFVKRESIYSQVIMVHEKTSVYEKLSYRQKIRLFRAKIYNFLEKPRGTVSFLYHLAVFIYIVFVHSFSALSTEWGTEVAHYMEVFLAAYFITEFAVRIWSIGADAKYSGFSGFLKYMTRLATFIDIVIIGVTIIIIIAHDENYLTPDTLEKIQFLQILRLLHIDRQMTTWKMIKKMIIRSCEELVAIYWISGLIFLLIAYFVYEIETFAENKRREMNETVEPTFQNYGESFWFAIITVMTVGYGDIVPKHWISKLAVGILCFFGVCAFAAGSSLVGVGMSLMVENETKLQQATKIRNLAARLIQSCQFRKFCSDLHHVEERIKTARMLAKQAVIKRQSKTKKFTQNSKRQASFQEKHSESYNFVAAELGLPTLLHNSALINNVAHSGNSKIHEVVAERYKNSIAFHRTVSTAELPPHLHSISLNPANVPSSSSQHHLSRDNDVSMASEASLGSVEFSDEEKLLEYYYDPYNDETASISKRSVDTTVNTLDDETINRYRQILRMLHYFIFQITKRKFNRARMPYELLDAENELCEMEYQRMQKIKELELRVQATVGKPTISIFQQEDQSYKLNIEDRLILCEEMLRKLELKAKAINDLGALIMGTVHNNPKTTPNPRKKVPSFGEGNPEEKLFSKLRGEQKRRVLFKEHSLG